MPPSEVPDDTQRENSRKVLDWETREGRSYLIPALEVPGFVILLNGFDRLAFHGKMKEGKRAYETSPSTIWDHVHNQHWGWDHDTFEVNQFGHPYEGATFFGLARSSGLNFWESLGYSHAGSYIWEMAGETTRPSINDMITTGNAGSLLGEALFRMAGLVLEDGGDYPDAFHEIAAAIVSPPTGFNRSVFGERFKSVYPSHRPAKFWRVRLGASYGTEGYDLGYGQPPHNFYGIVDFALSYGLPGKSGYSYRRPLDYFDFRLTVRSRAENFLENILLRGLLIGSAYDAGDTYRGIWGLYGSYDYISPFLMQISSTALSLGTTAEMDVAPDVTLQGSLLGGVGFAAAGSRLATQEEREHHYAFSPQWLLSLNVLFGERAYIDLAGRGYYPQAVEGDIDGSEVLYNCEAGVTVRVSGRHGVGVRWVESIRNTHYQQVPNRHQREGTVTLFYTYLSNNSRFGAVGAGR
ncbi:DUF3943 domain-containing protein [Geomonas sp. RF6]|uniref:DUF3943 domain-containing protein n=1 Tax=Geomonas sp. RF6 TaxID=2897342 RepID=UPI001E472980|nr:DUF3943 domain-containing protein [Geomonas sp. RF6]UFS70801.1 DUF3943 domain-containing protein [Geomonas sp. RF6]